MLQELEEQDEAPDRRQADMAAPGQPTRELVSKGVDPDAVACLLPCAPPPPPLKQEALRSV